MSGPIYILYVPTNMWCNHLNSFEFASEIPDLSHLLYTSPCLLAWHDVFFGMFHFHELFSTAFESNIFDEMMRVRPPRSSLTCSNILGSLLFHAEPSPWLGSFLAVLELKGLLIVTCLAGQQWKALSQSSNLWPLTQFLFPKEVTVTFW